MYKTQHAQTALPMGNRSRRVVGARASSNKLGKLVDSPAQRKRAIKFDGKKTVIEMKKYLCEFLKDERGLTTVEYAVAGGLISLAVVGGFQALGLTVDGIIRGINTAITTP